MTAPEAAVVERSDLDVLLAVAEHYLNAFSDDDRMSYTELWRYQDVQRVVLKHRAKDCICGAPVGDDEDDVEARRTWQHSRSCPLGR